MIGRAGHIAASYLHEDLHAATQTQHEVEGRLLLDVVVRKSASVLELLACEDQALLVRRNALLVLNLLLDVVDRVRRLDLQSDGLASESLQMAKQGKERKQRKQRKQRLSPLMRLFILKVGLPLKDIVLVF